jgi:hypothetical protein
MNRRTHGRRHIREFGVVCLANLLPVVGIAAFGWAFSTLVLLYWLDLVTFLLVYGVCSLFAQQPIVVEGRNMRLAWVARYGADDGWSEPSRAIQLSDRLPPVYVQNIKLLVPNLAVGLGLMLGAGSSILNVVQGYPTGSLRWLSDVASLSPTVLLGVGVMVAAQCVGAYRGYFESRRYERLSAHMVLEIPLRPIILLFAASLAGFVGVVLAAVAADAVIGGMAGYWTLVVLGVGGFLAVKLAIEWGRFWAERTDDPTGFAAWFTPEDPC